MKKTLSKLLSVLVLFTAINVTMPKKEAEAGIILAPSGVGLIFLIYGIVYDSVGLLILDDQANDPLVLKMEERFGVYTDNPMVFKNLAGMIKKEVSELGEIDQETEVNFTKRQIIKALGPAAANRDLLDAVEADLM